MPKLSLKPTTDPIADMLAQIRNALAVRQAVVTIPASKQKEQLLQIFKQYEFIEDYGRAKDAPDLLEIILFPDEGNSRINKLVRVSKPGRRSYVKANQIPSVQAGRGLAIVSTSSGLLPGHVAKRRGLGGELICKVW